MKIATRKSSLALLQTQEVQTLLQEFYPMLTTERVELSTKGDEILDRSLAELGGKGLFIKTLEQALVQYNADIAVHSLKDVPPTLEAQFTIAATLKRVSPHDTLISKKGGLDKLPKGARVGTSSVRRQAELLHYRPDLQTIMLRGNVQTRLKKLEEGLYDAIILAEAGLMRLGLTDHITEVLPTDIFLPSVGQGVIAIEILKDRLELIDLLAPLNDYNTYACISAERIMNAGLGASCTSPVGSFAQIKQDVLTLRGMVLSTDGKTKITTLQKGAIEDALTIGKQAAEDLISKGAKEIL